MYVVPRLGLAALIVSSVFSCETVSQKEERLAKQYCSRCHMFPAPHLLDKTTWEKSVLPQMAFRMGFENMNELMTLSEEDRNVVIASLPSQPMVSEEEWERIKSYYLRNAPDSLSNPATTAPQDLHQFEVTERDLFEGSVPATTLIRYDTIRKNMFIGTRTSKLYRFTGTWNMEDPLQLNSPPSHISFSVDGEPVVSLMGIMDPNDQARGSIVHLDKPTQPLIDSLQRPVYFEQADLNGDRRNDYVVCSFGNYTGALEVYENKNDQSFKKHVLLRLPGARKVVIKDLDNNGLPDLLVLMTQGDEKIVALYNHGDFNFRLATLLRFSPVFGSSFFDIADFNNDGKFDILYSNGDNADYSAVLKPYHGVRIFLNDGTNRFDESWFHPMHGASQALARDFDQDGDLDIAAISFFPDFKKHPEQAFLYFENSGNTFVPYVSPLGASGRWLTMEAADHDSDGDLDLLLGALNFETGVPPAIRARWKEKPVSILILTNTHSMSLN